MMRRSKAVNFFISMVLATEAGFFITLALKLPSAVSVLLAIFSLVTWAINALCGPDKESKNNNDKDEE